MLLTPLSTAPSPPPSQFTVCTSRFVQLRESAGVARLVRRVRLHDSSRRTLSLPFTPAQEGLNAVFNKNSRPRLGTLSGGVPTQGSGQVFLLRCPRSSALEHVVILEGMSWMSPENSNPTRERLEISAAWNSAINCACGVYSRSLMIYKGFGCQAADACYFKSRDVIALWNGRDCNSAIWVFGC